MSDRLLDQGLGWQDDIGIRRVSELDWINGLLLAGGGYYICAGELGHQMVYLYMMYMVIEWVDVMKVVAESPLELMQGIRLVLR